MKRPEAVLVLAVVTVASTAAAVDGAAEEIRIVAPYLGCENADYGFVAGAGVPYARLSYRFKYCESSSGPTSYHIGGIAYVF